MEEIGLEGGQKPTSDINKPTDVLTMKQRDEGKGQDGREENERIRGFAMNFTGPNYLNEKNKL